MDPLHALRLVAGLLAFAVVAAMALPASLAAMLAVADKSLLVLQQSSGYVPTPQVTAAKLVIEELLELGIPLLILLATVQAAQRRGTSADASNRPGRR